MTPLMTPHDPPMTPARAAPSYLSCIFTSTLSARLPGFCSWGAQILSVLAWGQLVLASDYPQMRVMRALHKAVHRVFAPPPPGLRKIVHTPCTPSHTACCAPNLPPLPWLWHGLKNVQHGGGYTTLIQTSQGSLSRRDLSLFAAQIFICCFR